MLNDELVAELERGGGLRLLRSWKEAGEVERLLAVARAPFVNYGARCFAIRYLATFPRADVVEALTELLADPEQRVRQRAARSLKEIGPFAQAAVAALTDALSDGDGWVRVAAAQALGAIGDSSALPALERAAELTSWDTLHAWATDSLVKLGSHEAARHLIDRLSAERRWQRRWAARELTGLGDLDAIPPLRAALTRDRLHSRVYAKAIRAIERRSAQA